MKFIILSILLTIQYISSHKQIYQDTFKILANVVPDKDKRASLLTLRDIFKINSVINPYKHGAGYLSSGMYIDEQEEYNQRIMNSNIFQDNLCFFDREKFMEYLNIIRTKHQVPKLSWDKHLEDQARLFATRMKNQNECKIISRSQFSELVYPAMERLTEKELLDKWYSPAYSYNFKAHKFITPWVNSNSMTVLLWDMITYVGCAKACCDKGEIYVCDFLPLIVQPTVEEMKFHILPNKFLK